MKTYIGIDNGATGTIGIITLISSYFIKTPSKKEQDYTKKKNNISRFDVKLFLDFISSFDLSNCMVVFEKPFTGKFAKTNMLAARFFEAQLITIEHLNLPWQVIPSSDWQKSLLPVGIKGSPEQKKASLDIGCRLFPNLSPAIKEHGDADGILIAEWARRNNL